MNRKERDVIAGLMHNVTRREGDCRLKVLIIYALLCVCCVFGTVYAQEITRTNERIVVTTSGDTLSVISLREFGSVAYGRFIAEYNELNFDSKLSAGLSLRIPLSAIYDTAGAEVVFAKGSALLLARGDRSVQLNLQTGDSVFAKDIIKTAETGFVSLRFPSGTIVNIQPNSVVALNELDCLEADSECVVSLEATAGGFNSNVRHRARQPTRLNVRTPHAYAAVRGTVFDINTSSEQVLLGVTDGTVDVSAQGSSTDVLAGLGVRTQAGQPPDPPVKLLAAPNFRRHAARLSEQDSLAWYRLDEAQEYRLEITRDEDGAMSVYAAATATLSHPAPVLEAGNYFANIRAVDELGFKGFNAQMPFVAVALDASAPELSLGLSPRDQRLIAQAEALPDAVTDYEVQLSFQPNFADPSSVDVPADGGIEVSATDTPTYLRARIIVDESTVGRYGPVLTIPAQ